MNCKRCGKPPKLARMSWIPYCRACAYLTIPETYAALHISRATYYRLVKAGKITPRQVSPGRILVPRSEVDAILGNYIF